MLALMSKTLGHRASLESTETVENTEAQPRLGPNDREIIVVGGSAALLAWASAPAAVVMTKSEAASAVIEARKDDLMSDVLRQFWRAKGYGPQSRITNQLPVRLMTALAARPKKEDAAEGEAAASSTTRS